MDMTDRQHDPDGARAAREQQFARARTLAAALTLAAVALAIWALLWPMPYAVVVVCLIALPVLAVVLTRARRTMFRIGFGAGYGEANLATPCMIAACALLARTLLDLNMIDWTPLIGMATFVAAVFLAVTMAFTILTERTRRRRWGRSLVAAVLTGAYAFGVLGQADSLLDPSAPAVLRSRVLDKTLGRTRFATYRLTLAPWGPVTNPAEVAVSHDLYNKVAPDDPVCIRLHDGALHLAWFTVMACR